MSLPVTIPNPLHPALYQRVQASFERQGMMVQLGVRLLDVAPGMCELELPYSDKVTQQQGSRRLTWR
jgi:acyl-coenzyme A thioesterase PaaI-like protein